MLLKEDIRENTNESLVQDMERHKNEAERERLSGFAWTDNNK